jgi:hypothetical protein
VVDLGELLIHVMRDEEWPLRFAPGDWIEHVEAASRSLPLVLAGFGFEISLDRPGVDFGLLVMPSTPSSSSQCGIDRFGSLPPVASGWDRVRRVVDTWVHGSGVAIAPYAFLEFDTRSGVQSLSAPSMFLRASELAQFRDVDGDRRILSVAERRSRLACRLLALLQQGQSECGSGAAGLAEVVSALPEGSILLHVGVMLSRRNQIRIHASIPAQMTEPYLAGLSWNGTLHGCARVIERYCLDAPLATLQLETSGRSVAPDIGIEFSHGSGLDAQDSNAWKLLIERLVEDGICRPEKYELLASWPKMRHKRLGLRGWPCTIRQDLSHVKITVRPGQPLRAKAYLSVVPSFSLFGPR